MNANLEPVASFAPRQWARLTLVFVGCSVLIACITAGVAHAFGPLATGAVLLFLLGASGMVVKRYLPAVLSYPRWYDGLPCYLSVQNRDLQIIETNHLFRRDFGTRTGEHCYEVYKRRATPCDNCLVLRTFETGQSHTAERKVIRNDGSVAEVVATSSPLYEKNGKPTAVAEMFTDVTEIKTLHTELERSREEYRRLFDIVPCYISIQNRDHEILSTNAMFRQDFGSCFGKKCYEAYKGGQAVCRTCPVEHTFRDGGIHSSEEIVITEDGDQASVVVHSMPILDDHGEVEAVMEVSTNITEVKRLQALATVGLAVSGMAHRIKNILMGLTGGVYVTNTGFELQEQDTIDEGWSMVQRNVDKVSKVTADLLFCAKGREPSLEDGVCPQAIVEEVHELFVERASFEGIEIRLEMDGRRTLGRYDPEALQNMVTNLTANALDACRFDPDIEHKQHLIVLGCRDDGSGGVVVAVADNGAGIPDDVKDKVFDGFFSTKGTEGTGLGLLVVQKVVEEHGGRVTFTTEEGKGTSFEVALPRLDPETQAEDARGGGLTLPPNTPADIPPNNNVEMGLSDLSPWRQT